MSNEPVVRIPSKAGTWYPGSRAKLDDQIGSWFQEAGGKQFGPAKAIITPHAGFQYSGEIAAHGFKEIDPLTTKRIFILGPSHYVSIKGIAVTKAEVYETPNGKLKVDRTIVQELKDTGLFKEMSMLTDHEEHSIELQLPFIVKLFRGLPNTHTIVPLLVGSLKPEQQATYGQVLAKYLAEPGTVFVISSDFCHWGYRFAYQFYHSPWGPIYSSIERIDKLGMKAIKSFNLVQYNEYLRKYNNTICGKHPIAVLLSAVEHLNEQSKADPTVPCFKIKFLKYAQSSQCLGMDDSSVSYTTGVVKEFRQPVNLEPVEDVADSLQM